MELKVTQEPLENRQIELTVEVDQAHVDQEMKKAARKVARQYQFPGFRKGKAPYSIVVQYAGKEALYSEFVDDLGEQVYKQVLEDEDIEPYAMASLTDIQFDPLRYILHVPLDPEIDLGDYRSWRVEVEKPEVTEEQIDERLKGYQEEYADWADVDRPSEFGDSMTIDVRSVLTEAEEGDEETVVLDETEWEMTPDLENPTDPPGFDEALTGLKSGDEKEFTLSWPEDSQSIYAGKSANFKVKVHSVQSFENAELNDELAQLIGPDFETVADLRESVRETLQEEAENQAEAEYLERTFEKALENATLNYPPVVVEDQLDSMMNDFASQLRRYGIEDLDSYLENVGQTREEMRESQRESATTMAERNLILSEIIQLEGLIANDEDIDKEINLMLGSPSSDEDSDEGEVYDYEPGDEEDLEDDVADEETPVAEAEGVVAEADSDTDSASEDDQADEVSPEEQYRANMFEMFRDGPGRPMIESQVLTQKATERLLAIARGEELPEAVPLPKEDKSKAEDTNGSDEADADDASTDEAAEAVVES